MSTEKKTFEVIQCIPAFTYVTYHVEEEDEDTAIDLVSSYDGKDPDVKHISEHTEDSDFWGEYQYEVEEL